MHIGIMGALRSVGRTSSKSKIRIYEDQSLTKQKKARNERQKSHGFWLTEKFPELT